MTFEEFITKWKLTGDKTDPTITFEYEGVKFVIAPYAAAPRKKGLKIYIVKDFEREQISRLVQTCCTGCLLHDAFRITFNYYTVSGNLTGIPNSKSPWANMQ